MTHNRPRSIEVHQVLASLSYGDAIGNEVMGIQRVLRTADYVSNIYVQAADRDIEHLTIDYRHLPENSCADNILIHHFSIGSRASRVAFALPERMILVYHNITPPDYFLNINGTLVQFCYDGRRELGAYAQRCDVALGDSEFNRLELEDMGFPRTGVLPVVPNFAHLDVSANRFVSKDFDDNWTNILFVGRLVPHKRIEDLVRFFHTYRLKYNPQSRLLLVGSYSGFDNYLASISQLISTLGTPDVHIIGHVSNEELTALYDVADVFLSASEHEGFCVPIIEAFYKRVPVIAFHSTAVPATMDGGGVLYDYKDPRHVASLIHAVTTNHELEREILQAQDEAVVRLQRKDFARTLLAFVERVRKSRRMEHPPIAPEFWDQFKKSLALDELQRFRPAAYQALPNAPDSDDCD